MVLTHVCTSVAGYGRLSILLKWFECLFVHVVGQMYSSGKCPITLMLGLACECLRSCLLTEVIAGPSFAVSVDRMSMASAWHLVSVIDLQDSLDTMRRVTAPETCGSAQRPPLSVISPDSSTVSARLSEILVHDSPAQRSSTYGEAQ